MINQNKMIVADDIKVDLGTFLEDDSVLSGFLLKHNSISTDKAKNISRAVRKKLEALDGDFIPLPLIERILKEKLAESGYPNISSISVGKNILDENKPLLTRNAKIVLERRYLKKDENGNPMETPKEMFRRVAAHIARAEAKLNNPSGVKKMEEVFYKMMTELKFLPNSPTLMNANRELGQLAACFVLPVEDSMEGIFDALKNAAIIHKSGGGTGFSFSRLRPKNSRVGTTGGVASGPVSFMRVFNTATEQVKQGGTRRGANMAILRVDHPDIMEFIHCKKDDNALNNFNISVGITDKFMEALKKGQSYDLFDPRDMKKVSELNSTEVYETIVKQAWENGDPGIVFLDRLNKDNPTPHIGEIESTNPCGEQPLLPMEACNLGSINLAKFIKKDGAVKSIDYKSLEKTVYEAVRFLDNTIEMSRYPIVEIDKMVKANRKIGLGIMGFADLLYHLEIPYNSQKAIDMAGEIMGFIQKTGHKASRALAEERGPFPNFDKSIYKDRGEKPIRNATVTTIAPTGSLSIIAGCSSGIEPLFAISFVRNIMDNDELLEVHPIFEDIARKRGFYSKNLMRDISQEGTIAHMDEIPEDIRRIFVTAHDISPEWHIKMQAAFQKYTDNAVSKTVNLPSDSTVEDVKKIYDLAYELGCKGVTIYRDGSKQNQVLSVKTVKDSVATVKERPETLEGFTTKIKTGLGQLYVTVTEYEGAPFEVFATIGKSGRSTTAKTEAIGRLISLALRSGVKVDKIVEQLKGIGGEHPIFQNGSIVMSIPDAISRVLENRYMDNKKHRQKTTNHLMGEKCPECGETISFEEGCMICHFCGFSKCG